MKKIIGWVLLVLGLLVIVWTGYSSWQIFNNQKPAPDIFALVSNEEAGSAAGGAQEQVQQMVSEQLGKLMPAGAMPKLLNLIAWSIGAAILVLVGGKISSIGIKLLRS